MRLDQWLDIACLFRTRSEAQKACKGGKVDVTISAIGDADSLQGGTLAVTPLMGADGEVYALAQGNVQVGGFLAQGAAAVVQRGVPTSGRIPNGGTVEREVNFELKGMRAVKVALHNPDLTTADFDGGTVSVRLGNGAGTAWATEPARSRRRRPTTWGRIPRPSSPRTSMATGGPTSPQSTTKAVRTSRSC